MYGKAVVLQVAMCVLYVCVVLLKWGNNDVCISVNSPASVPVPLLYSSYMEVWQCACVWMKASLQYVFHIIYIKDNYGLVQQTNSTTVLIWIILVVIFISNSYIVLIIGETNRTNFQVSLNYLDEIRKFSYR